MNLKILPFFLKRIILKNKNGIINHNLVKKIFKETIGLVEVIQVTSIQSKYKNLKKMLFYD